MGITFEIITVIHEASITDWIQAVAALLAVIGTVFTLWKLYERDEQKQAMIGELKTQAAESIKQTGHLADQVTQLGQQVFQLERIHEAIAKGIEHMAQDEALKKELKKISLRPDFEFQSFMQLPGRLEAKLNVLNRGGSARNLRLTVVEGTPVTADLPDQVRGGDELVVRMRSMVMMDINPVFNIEFEDELGNRYVQRFDMRPGQPFTGMVRPFETNDTHSAK